MAKLYMTGVTNYLSSIDSFTIFNITKAPVAFEQRKDGHNSIIFLSDKPTYVGQPVYIGTNPKYNDAAKRLMED